MRFGFNIFALLPILFIGCTSYTTIRERVEIPETTATSSQYTYHTIKQVGYDYVNVDSLKLWTLENLCKGTANIDTAGMKVIVKYSWKRDTTYKYVTDSLLSVIETISVELTKKKQIIEAMKYKEELTTWKKFIIALPYSLVALFIGYIIGRLR